MGQSCKAAAVPRSSPRHHESSSLALSAAHEWCMTAVTYSQCPFFCVGDVRCDGCVPYNIW